MIHNMTISTLDYGKGGKGCGQISTILLSTSLTFDSLSQKLLILTQFPEFVYDSMRWQHPRCADIEALLAFRSKISQTIGNVFKRFS